MVGAEGLATRRYGGRAGSRLTASFTLHALAQILSPSLRATAKDAALSHDVLYSGMRPDDRTASAQAALTRAASPRPRNSRAVSSPASVACPDFLAQQHTLMALSSCSTAAIGARPPTSSAVQPGKYRTSRLTSSANTTPVGSGSESGRWNAGPPCTSPSIRDRYRRACTGGARESPAGGSSAARFANSRATRFGVSQRTAHAQLSKPRASQNTGPRTAPGSRVPTIRPSSSNRNNVCMCNCGVVI